MLAAALAATAATLAGSTAAIAAPANTNGAEWDRKELLAIVEAALEDAPDHLKVDKEKLKLLTTEQLLAVPVSETYVDTSARTARLAAPTAETGCTTADPGGYNRLYNALGNEILRWKITQFFCWNRTAYQVTLVNQPRVDQHIAQWAAALGWSWTASPKQQDGPYTFTGGQTYVTWRQDEYALCTWPGWCINYQYPWMTVAVYAHGAYTFSGGFS